MDRRDEMTTSENFERRGPSAAQQRREQQLREAQREADERRNVAQDASSESQKADQGQDVQKEEGQQASDQAQQDEIEQHLKRVDALMQEVYEVMMNLDNSDELANFLSAHAQSRHHFEVLRGTELARAAEMRAKRSDAVKEDVIEDMKVVRSQAQEGKKV